MEHVAFLIESTGERIRCLLNPESLVLRRHAGVGPRRSAGGIATGSKLADDPVFFTGGGTTELTLDLLFDVELSGSSIQTTDVRDLTGPLWDLTENDRPGHELQRPPSARFIWGKAWNVPGIITAVAERLERFTPGGHPQRAWLRMRMLRVAESMDDLVGGAIAPPLAPEDLDNPPPDTVGERGIAHEVIGSDTLEGATAGGADRLDQLAFLYYGDPAHWRVLAWLNDIADPLRLGIGQVVQVAARVDLDVTR